LHCGKPSPLFTFVKIITQLDTKSISDIYKDYKKTIIDDEIKNNPIFEYIYNPISIAQEIYKKMLFES